MKLKRFNEQIKDKSLIDPYNEENWSDKPMTFDERGRCVHCGSDNITFDDPLIGGNYMYYRYECNDCDRSGEEQYRVEFITNVPTL